jgi:hypothetical protein
MMSGHKQDSNIKYQVGNIILPKYIKQKGGRDRNKLAISSKKDFVMQVWKVKKY